MLGLVTFFYILHQYSLLDKIKTNIDSVIYACFMFVILWAIFGTIILKLGYIHQKKYFRYELLSSRDKLNSLKRLYEEKFMKKKMKKSVYNKMEYHVMRQAFINPVELPSMTEAFLRRDFNFAYYLGLSLAEDFDSNLSIRVESFAFFIFAMIGWRLVNMMP